MMQAVTMSDTEKYILARWFYASGDSSFMSDEEYDSLERKLKKENSCQEYTSRSWSLDECPVELLKKYNYEDSIQKIIVKGAAESIPSILSYDELKKEYGSMKSYSTVSFKLDGWNNSVTYYNGKAISARTRGRASDGLNTDVILKIVPSEIPYMGLVTITGELLIPNKKWNEFKEVTGNVDQRTSVRTCLAYNMTDYLEFCAFAIVGKEVSFNGNKFDELRRLGFCTPRYMPCDSYSGLVNVIKTMSKAREKYSYPSDGLVVDSDLGQWAVRLEAWGESGLISTVTGYSETPGMYGVNMLVEIEPVEINGRTHKLVNVTNIANIVECNLKVGNRIAFSIRSATNPVLLVSKTKELNL